MGAELNRQIADMAGPTALPRKNGELVFDAAWEGRVFGLASAMHGAGLFAWDEFRDRLIEEIAEADRHEAASGGQPPVGPGHGASAYYEHWLDAFERLLVEKGLLSREEIAARLAEFDAGQRDDAF